MGLFKGGKGPFGGRGFFGKGGFAGDIGSILMGGDPAKRNRGIPSRLDSYSGDERYGRGMGAGVREGLDPRTDSTNYSPFGNANYLESRSKRDLNRSRDLQQGPRQQYDPTAANAAVFAAAKPLAETNAHVGLRQFENLDSLRSAAAGETPSAAELAMRQQAGQNVANQFAMSRGIGGAAGAGAARQAQQQGAMMGGDLTAQLGAQRAAEQAQARGMYTGALSGMYGQGLDQAALGLQGAQTIADIEGQRVGAALSDQQLRDQGEQFFAESSLGAAGMDLESRMARDKARRDAFLGMYGADRGVSAAAAGQKDEGLIGPLLGASTTMGAAAMSDRRLKKDEKRLGKGKGPQPVEFRYKWDPPGAPKKRGYMAQDLEEDPKLKDAVVETPYGKAVDYTKVAAELGKRLAAKGGKRAA